MPMVKHIDIAFPCQQLICLTEFLSKSQPQIISWVRPAISHDQLQLLNREQSLQEDKSISVPKVLRLQW